MNEELKITGRVRVQIKEGDQIVQDTGWLKNIITNTGKAGIAGLAGNTGGVSAFTYLAVGTDATAASASQTALIAEIVNTGLARAAATVSRITTTQTNDTLQLTYSWTVTAPGGNTINEIGVFNASSAGIMLGRKVLSVGLSTVTGQVVVATYTIQFS